MMRLMKLLSIVGVGLLISGTAEAQQRYVLSLNWIPHALHYGIYVAKEKGWYKSAGIDLDIQRGYGSGDTVKRVATGAAAFGLADAASVIVGRAQGLDTKLVAMIMDRPADAVYFIKGSGIAKPKDLEGKTMGAAAGETSLNLLPVFAKNAGFDAGKIKIVTMTSTSKIPSLVEHKVDSIVTFTNEEPMVRNAGKKADVPIGRFLFADYGVDYYSVGFIVSDATLREKPAVVKAFVDATMRGFAEAVKNPNEVADDFAKNNPATSRDLMLQQWGYIEHDMLTPTAAAKGLGYMEPGKMEKTIALMKAFQHVTADIKPADVYTDQYLPKIEVKQ